MKFAYSLIIPLFLLASCAPAARAGALPEAATATAPPAPTATQFIITPPTSEPTQTPCNPLVVDFCVTEGHFILLRPIQPPYNDSVDGTYRYASTANGTRDPHHGVEFLNRYGTPVYAAADGVVLFAGPDNAPIYSPRVNFYGNVVVVRHAGDLFTLYAHLSAVDVRQGDEVKAGEKIGEVGQSGVATGSHLHFEVRKGNGEDYFAVQNPELWLAPERRENGIQYGVAMISVEDGTGRQMVARLTLQRYAGAGAVEKTYYLDTYVSDMAFSEENAAIGDLPPGRYRIALKLNGHLYERWVEVESGMLTQVVFLVS
jgi:hypothetical protein